MTPDVCTIFDHDIHARRIALPPVSHQCYLERYRNIVADDDAMGVEVLKPPVHAHEPALAHLDAAEAQQKSAQPRIDMRQAHCPLVDDSRANPLPAVNLALAHSLSAQGFEDAEATIYLMDLERETVDVLFTRESVLAVHPMGKAVLADPDTDPRMLYFKKPEWSHDGSLFFFVYTNAQEGPRPEKGIFIKSLFVASADGSDLCYLGEFGRAPMWGPGDGYVYTVDPIDEEGSRTVVAHPIDGSDPYPLLPRIEGIHANLSPDGERIAIDVFGWPEPDRAAIWLYDAPSGEHVVAAEFGAPDRSHATGVHPHPAWSRNGKRVYFAAGEENLPRLYAIDVGDV